MKYFIEKSCYDFGESRFIEVSEKYGDSLSAHEINIIEGCYTFHLYLLPQNSGYLLCVWFAFDSVLNVNHWDDILGLPRLISPNEFLKYKSIMAKPFPNYIHAYERGRNKDFSAPALFRVGDVAQNGTKKWCMCKRSNWSYGANHDLLEECYVLLRYVIEMFKQLKNNNIDWKDRVWLNIKEGVKKGFMAYFAPLSLLGDIYSEIDWSEIAKIESNW